MKTILVADEDEKMRNTVRFALTEDAGYRVVSVTTGNDAITKAKELKPDVVILDSSLSDIDGYQISREIKNNMVLKNAFVILLASSPAFDQTKLKESLADAVIIKSSDLTDKIGGIFNKLELSSKSQEKSYTKPIALTLALILIFAVVVVYMIQKDLIDKRWIELISIRNREEGKEIVISVKNKDEIFIEFIGRKQYSLSGLEDGIQSLIKDQKKGAEEYIYLRADSAVPIDLITKIIAKLKEKGVSKLVFITEITSPINLEQRVGEDITTRGNDSKLDDINKSEEEKDSPKEIAIEQIFLTITAAAANIRSGPGTNYPVLSVAKRGDIYLKGDEQQGNWIKVINQGGQGGWISGELLRNLNDH